MAAAVTRHTRRRLRPATALRFAATLLAVLLVAASARAEFLDWTDVTWPAGSRGARSSSRAAISRSSTVTATVTDASGVRPAGFPAIQTGFNGFDNALRLRANFANTSQLISLRYASAAPVSNLRFDVGDIDTGSASSPYTGWQDILTVTAFRGGVEVPVTATPLGAAVAVDANNSYSTGSNATVYGRTGDVAAASTAGNARFTVAGPVDQIRIDYRAGNSPDNIPGNGPANPTEQGINFADLIFDAQADLSLTKVASNSAPDVGSTVTYTLTLTNGGPAAATGITVADVLPVGLSYVAGSIAGGNARTRPAADAHLEPATLASGASTDLTFDATVNVQTGAAGEYDNRAQVTVAPQPDPDSTPNNGTTNAEDDRAQVTLTPAVPVSGFVYEDLDHDSTRDAIGDRHGPHALREARAFGDAVGTGVASRRRHARHGRLQLRERRARHLLDRDRHLEHGVRRDADASRPAGCAIEESDFVRSVTVASAGDHGPELRPLSRQPRPGRRLPRQRSGRRHAGQRRARRLRARARERHRERDRAGCGGSCDSTTTAAGGAFTLWIAWCRARCRP